MLHDGCLAFVEVRCRTTSSFVRPGDTIDHRKQRKIIRTAAMFGARNRHFANHTMRFDVVSIEGEDPPSIRWIRDAFRPDDSTL